MLAEFCENGGEKDCSEATGAAPEIGTAGMFAARERRIGQRERPTCSGQEKTAGLEQQACARRSQILFFQIDRRPSELQRIHTVKETPMTPEKIKLVQDSFAKVAPIAGQAADIFYDRLFEIAPDVRPMFPADMSNQKDKLMQTLGVAVNNLHQVETILPTVQELGRKHVGYGVKDEHYDTVGAALLFTLEKGLGDAFTPDVKEAWTETFVTVAGVMKEAAATVPEPKKGFLSKLFG